MNSGPWPFFIMPVSVLCLHFLQLSFEDTKDFIQVNTELFLVFLSKHLFKIRTASFEVGYTAPPYWLKDPNKSLMLYVSEL